MQVQDGIGMREHSLAAWNVNSGSHFSKLVRWWLKLCALIQAVCSWALREEWFEWWEMQNLSCETWQKQFGGFHWRRKDSKEYETKYLDDWSIDRAITMPNSKRHHLHHSLCEQHHPELCGTSQYSQSSSLVHGQGFTIPNSRSSWELCFSSISARTSELPKSVVSCLDGLRVEAGWPHVLEVQ